VTGPAGYREAKKFSRISNDAVSVYNGRILIFFQQARLSQLLGGDEND
jgi:hypothetical protein